MKGFTISLSLSVIMICTSAQAEALCLDDGTPNLGYHPVKSDYFNEISTSSSLSQLVNPGVPKFDLFDADSDAGVFPSKQSQSISLARGVVYDSEFKLPGLPDSNAVKSPAVDLMSSLAALSKEKGRYVIVGDEEGFCSLVVQKAMLFKIFDGNKRTVYPPPSGSSGDPARNSPLSALEKVALEKCRSSVYATQELQIDDRGVVTPEYACTLLQFDKYCLSGREVPPGFGAESYKKVVVALFAVKDKPECMGVLVKDSGAVRLVTSRHCFVDRFSGVAAAKASLAGETLDQKRIIEVDRSSIKRLEIPCSHGDCSDTQGTYGPDRDAISIVVKVKELPGAAELPDVKIDTAVKGCITASNKDLGDKCTRVWVLGVVPNLLAAERLEAQATHVPVSNSWVDAVRWSRWYGGYTRIDYLEEHCAYYTSQTTPGFSGTPLFTRSEIVDGKDVLYMAGVHAGAVSADSGSWPACATNIQYSDSRRFSLNVADLQVEKL